MSLTAQVARYISDHALMPPGAQVLVGVSGGVDSVVLLHVLNHLGYAPIVAHVNYQMRGAASDEDEAFVQSLAERLGVPFHGIRFQTKKLASESARSFQEVARDLRFSFFGRIADEHGLDAVAVGHHLDDQAETVLLNLFRGTGPEGLAGMPVKRKLLAQHRADLVRPLLGVSRDEIDAYARSLDLTWRTDQSNAGTDYRRNALRNVIFPAVEQYFGTGARANIARAAVLVRAYVDATLQPSIEEDWAALVEPDEGQRRLKLDVLAAMPSVRRRRALLEALRRWLPDAPLTYTMAEEIEHLLTAQPGRRVQLKQGAIWRDRAHVVFAPATDEELPPVSFKLGETAFLPEGRLQTHVLDHRPRNLDPGTLRVAYLDADLLDSELTARPWRPGDRFQPLGMGHPKKVSDFLTDARVSPSRRKAVYVLCSGEQIVWVVGLRIAHDARIRPDTSRIAKITFVPYADTSQPNPALWEGPPEPGHED